MGVSIEEQETIILDPCSSDENKKCENHFTKCRRKAPALGHGDIRRPILLVF